MKLFQRATEIRASALRDKRRMLATVALVAVGSAYALVLFKNTCFTAGGSDSSGYLNEARLLAQGRILQQVPQVRALGLPDDWTPMFVPLGFGVGPLPRTMAPSYPPGVPLHMAMAARIGGWSRAPFLVSPIAGLLALILIYALALEFGLPSSSALAASTILGLSPIFVFQAVQPMSDVIATFWCLLTMVCCLRSTRITGWATGAGAAFGIAVLVRPTNALLLPAILFALPLRPKQLFLFLVGGLPFGAWLLFYNHTAYGAPFETGYGSLVASGLLAPSHFPARIQFYARQLIEQLSPLIPPAGLAVVLSRKISLRHRLMLLVWPLAYLTFFSFYRPYEDWSFVRFLLPSFPGFIVGSLLLWQTMAEKLTKFPKPVPTLIALIAFVAITVAQLYQVSSRRVLEVDELESQYSEVSAISRKLLPANSLVICMQMSGSLYYYTSFGTARSDRLDNQRMDTFRKLGEERGAPLYAVLFPNEVLEVERKVRGKWTRMGDFRGVSLWKIHAAPDIPPRK